MQILTDSTVDTAGVLIDAHTPAVGAWAKNTVNTGTAGVSNANRFRLLSTQSPVYYCTVVPAGPDESISFDTYVASITVSVAVHGGYLRMSTTVDTGYVSGYQGSTLSWSIHKYVAGTKTILASAAATLTVSNTYTCLFTIVGSSLTLWVNGVSTVTASDSTITAAGSIGLRFANQVSTDTTSFHLTNLKANDFLYPDVWGMQSQVGLPVFPRSDVVGY